MAKPHSTSDKLTRKPKHERSVKVASTCYDYICKDKPMRYVTVPSIRIKGHWLKQAGFTTGTQVRIRVIEGCLVMTID